MTLTATQEKTYNFGAVGSVNGKELSFFLTLFKKSALMGFSQCTLSNKSIRFSQPDLEMSATLPSLNFQDIITVRFDDLFQIAKLTSGDISLQVRDGSLVVDGSIVLGAIVDEILPIDVGEAASDEFTLPTTFPKVALGITEDESRLSTSGLGVSLRDKKIALTNGHYLLYSDLEYSKTNSAHWTIPYEAIELVKKEQPLTCQFFRKDNSDSEKKLDPEDFCILSSLRMTVITKIAHEFPNFMKLLGDAKPVKITFSNKEMAQALVDCLVFKKKDRTKFINCYGEANTLEITAHSELGDIKRKVKATGVDNLIFGVDAKYLALILKTQPEGVLIESDGNSKNGTVTTPFLFSGSDIKAILMPSRVF